MVLTSVTTVAVRRRRSVVKTPIVRQVRSVKTTSVQKTATTSVSSSSQETAALRDVIPKVMVANVLPVWVVSSCCRSRLLDPSVPVVVPVVQQIPIVRPNSPSVAPTASVLPVQPVKSAVTWTRKTRPTGFASTCLRPSVVRQAATSAKKADSNNVVDFPSPRPSFVATLHPDI